MQAEGGWGEEEETIMQRIVAHQEQTELEQDKTRYISLQSLENRSGIHSFSKSPQGDVVFTFHIFKE